MICINCNTEHTYKFCPNCGEKSEIKKITFVSIIHDAFTTITNMDKGFLFNVKHLFLRPNKIVNDYILGKRKGIFNPISFLIIAVTIYLIIETFIGYSGGKSNSSSKAHSIGYASGVFLKSYFKYFWVLSIVWLGLSTKLIFGKYNYAEHLTISAFIIGQATLIGTVGFVLLNKSMLFNPFVYIVVIWMTFEIFKEKDRNFSLFIESFASTFLFFIQLLFIVIGIGYINS